MRYIVVTAASLPNDGDGDDDEVSPDEVEVALDIASYEGQALLFDNRHDAEDFMDAMDVSVEMVVIEAPESLDGIIVV